MIPHVGRKLAELGLCHAGVCHVELSRVTVPTTFPLRSRGLSDKGEGPWIEVVRKELLCQSLVQGGDTEGENWT